MIRILFVCFMVPCGLFFPVFDASAAEKTIYTSPYVSVTQDGMAWTTNPGDRDIRWYPRGERVETGVGSSLRAPGQGEHYYMTMRQGTVPVGYWKVQWEPGQCIHNSYPPPGYDYHGISYGRQVCQRFHYSGWIPYCADCGERLSDALIYMSSEAAATIGQIQMGCGMSYYYLCPFCNNLEQARGLDAHYCKAISYNQYRVRYDANCDHYAGYMRNSIHMYQNAEVYEGSPVTPETHLSWNSYLRAGYVFTGWNTKPDGTGTDYADGEEIWNLTDCDYYADAKAGTVVLYAQWEAVRSTLYIDPNGGSYQGNGGITAVMQGYGTTYEVEEGDVEPPPGHRVSFQCNGGREVSDITGTMHFTEWNMEMPFHGTFQEGSYTYGSEAGDSDLLTACYEYDSITLPATEKQGSSFGGWYYDAEFEYPAGAAGDSITPTTDLTLYAQWVDLTLYAEENYRAYGGKGAVNLSWNQSDHKNKWYLLYQSTDGVNWNKIFRGDDIEKDRTVKITGSREGKPQTFTVRDTGLYTITAAGAQGGGYGGFAGGQGGSVTASFWLKRGEVLTYTVGGADGYNGGGKGDTYTDGGGCTVVSSDQKGILLVAGGGGGATSGGPGGAGGSQTGLLDTGYDGEPGGAGGGGGYRGGAAGERIVHHHTNSCYRDSSYDGLEGAVLSWRTEYHVAVNHDSDDYDCDDCYQYDLRRAGSMANPIPVRGNTSVNVQAALWKQICRNGELWPDSYMRVYDQNGRCFFYQDLSSILHETDVLEENIIERQNRAWVQSRTNVRFPRFHTEFVWWLPEKDNDDEKNGGYTYYYSVRNSDGTSGVAGEYKRDRDTPVERLWGTTGDSGYPINPDHNFTVSGDTGYHLENTPLFFVRDGGCFESGVLLDYTIEIPEGTTGIYVEAYAKGGSAVSHDTVKALITRIRLQGGKEAACGMTEGQIIASKPSYGGSSYVNEEYAFSYRKESGVQEGDGTVSLQSLSVGYTEEHSLEDVWAPDLASPDEVDTKRIRKEGLAAGEVLVTWEKPVDHGTVYYHVAESYFAGSGEALCRSNETADTLTSGVKGYYYCIDNNSDTEVTAGDGYTEETELTVSVGEKTCYLHLSAVDAAGNKSGTIHILLDADAAARPLHTEPLAIEEGENVYPAGERRWYIRSDGVTPVTLRYGSYIDGVATERYQINYALFVSMDKEGQVPAYNCVCVENQTLSSGSIRIPDRLLRLSAENEPLLAFYPYTQAYRKDSNRRLAVTQSYTLETAASGKQVEVYPRAGADWAGEIFYSAQEEDRRNGLTLIGDGEPPVIHGMELLKDLSLIDRRVNAPVLNLTVGDELSGVREFYLIIYNGDNNCSRRFEPDEAGLIRVELTAEDPVFSGDFTAVAHAVDNVGNEITVSEETTEFGLTARIERILSPHDPVFQNGESGILSVAVWGYPDYVEIEFPAEMTEQNPGLNRRIEYAGSPRYCQEEEIQFMIPLYTPSNADYTVTVRAYKGNRRLEQYPELSVVEVSGTVLDDFRTRLR